MNSYLMRKIWVVPAVVLVCAWIAGWVGSGQSGCALDKREAPAVTGGVSAGEISQLSAPDGAILVDHRQANASVIPQSWLDTVRGLDIFFAHMSVGYNILDGLSDLQEQDPGRYTIVVYSGGADWFETHSGLLHRPLGHNYDPLLKVAVFDNDMRSGGFHHADVAMMKFCPGDLLPDLVAVSGQEIWDAYRPMMAALEQDYPDVTVVWWTFPLTSAAAGRGLGNDERSVFNAAVRGYCAANGCVLFDIAAIQSHDPSGTPIVDGNGREAMWDGYTYDGGHLNEAGRQRVANALWWLLARTAGWDGPGAQQRSYIPLIVR